MARDAAADGAAPRGPTDLDITPADLRPYVTIARAVGTIDRDLDVAALVWQGGP